MFTNILSHKLDTQTIVEELVEIVSHVNTGRPKLDVLVTVMYEYRRKKYEAIS